MKYEKEIEAIKTKNAEEMNRVKEGMMVETVAVGKYYAEREKKLVEKYER